MSIKHVARLVLAKRAATLVEYETAVAPKSASSAVFFQVVNVAIARRPVLLHRPLMSRVQHGRSCPPVALQIMKRADIANSCSEPEIQCGGVRLY